MMTNGWQEVSLGSLLTRIKDDVVIQDFEKYQRLTIRTNNKGIDIRDELEGHLIGTKNQYVVHGGQFLLSKIDAMNGAFGIVPEHVENGIITSNFWAYDVNEEKLFPKYFNYLTHTNSFQEFCIQASSGTTHRKYLREDLFLGMEIPLPPLTEQRRIVAHIESLAARVNEAQSLREEADIEAKSLLNSALSKITQDLLSNHEPQTLGELTLFIGDMNHDMPKGQEKGIPFISPKDFIKKDGNIGIDFDSAKKITREDFERLSRKACPQKGDILMARYGTIGAARYVDTDREFLASYSIAVIRPNPELVDGRFLYWMSISPYVQEQAIKGIRGSGMADLGLKTIREFIIPHLNFDEQRRIVAYLDGLQVKVNALRGLQSQSQEELDVLLPSVLDRAFKGEV